MTMWARIEDSIVMEVTDIDPVGRFHPDLAWQPCSLQVRPGWLFENGTFAAKVETLEERSAAERRWRDGELAAWQWLRDRHRDEQDLGRTPTLASNQFDELLAYLQSLRDWPQSAGFPDEVLRPLAPTWLAGQQL